MEDQKSSASKKSVRVKNMGDEMQAYYQGESTNSTQTGPGWELTFFISAITKHLRMK